MIENFQRNRRHINQGSFDIQLAQLAQGGSDIAVALSWSCIVSWIECVLDNSSSFWYSCENQLVEKAE
jgi:hypothetical protein